VVWREVRFLVFSFCWASPAQPFSDLSPMGLMSIFYCLYFWDSPNLDGQVPVFISPRNSAAQLYPRTLSLSISRIWVILRLTVSWPVHLGVGPP
jgi:hypothetical protein